MKELLSVIRHLVFPVLLFVLLAAAIQAETINDTTFDNGLTLLTLEDKSSQLVSMLVCYHVGIKDDPPGLSGLTQITRQIILEGTADYKKGEYERIIQGGGGRTSSQLTRDYIRFSAVFPKQIIDTVLYITSCLMQDVNVSYENLISARETIRKHRLSSVESSIYGPLNEEIFSLAFSVHPYRNPYYGWPDDALSITTEIVEKFIRSNFQASNSTIIIAGDIDTEKLTDKVNNLYGSVFSLPAIARRKIVEPPHRGERISIVDGTSDIPTVVMAHNICPVTDLDMPAVRIMHRILADGESSRIFKKLVYGDGLALVTGGNLIEGEDAGIIVQYAILNYDARPEEGKEMLCSEIERLQSEDVTEAELMKAKNQIEAEYYRGSSSLSQKAGRLADFQIVYGDWRFTDSLVSQARAVTKEDIRKAANKYLKRINRTSVLLLPAGEFDDYDMGYPD